MTTPNAIGTLAAAPANDVVGALRVCHSRLLEREGIAMFVALHDGRPGRSLEVHDERARTEGRRLADLLDHYHSRLEAAGFPSFDDDDAPDESGAPELISSLVVLSDLHLRARPGDA